MGRGLSDLQKDILRRAYRNREELPERMRRKVKKHLRERKESMARLARSGHDTSGLTLPSPDAPGYRPELQPDITPREVVEAVDPGARRRRSVQAAVSRTLTRLIGRGLLLSKWGVGLKLTETGLAIAEELSVNTVHQRGGANR
jgi:hypothetical protein